MEHFWSARKFTFHRALDRQLRFSLFCNTFCLVNDSSVYGAGVGPALARGRRSRRRQQELRSRFFWEPWGRLLGLWRRLRARSGVRKEVQVLSELAGVVRTRRCCPNSPLWGPPTPPTSQSIPIPLDDSSVCVCVCVCVGRGLGVPTYNYRLLHHPNDTPRHTHTHTRKNERKSLPAAEVAFCKKLIP